MPPFEREWASALRVAEALRGLRDPRADLVASGANGVAFGVASAESRRGLHGGIGSGNDRLELFMDPVTWLGSDVWVFDDDGHAGSLAPTDEALSELDEALGARPHARVHAQVFHRSDQLADSLSRRRAWPRLTHLITDSPPPRLLDLATDLVGLTGAYDGLASLFPGRPCGLHALTLGAHPPPNEARFLDAIQARCPQLRHLGLWHVRSLRWLHHPIVDGLLSLDLYTVNDARQFDFRTLLEERQRLSHLRRVLVPGHQVSDAVRADFADWPEVVFVSYDRGEVMALDIATMGFPCGHR